MLETEMIINWRTQISHQHSEGMTFRFPVTLLDCNSVSLFEYTCRVNESSLRTLNI